MLQKNNYLNETSRTYARGFLGMAYRMTDVGHQLFDFYSLTYNVTEEKRRIASLLFKIKNDFDYKPEMEERIDSSSGQ